MDKEIICCLHNTDIKDVTDNIIFYIHLNECTNGDFYYIFNEGFYYACKNGYLDVVEFMLNKGSCNLNFGFYGACEKGYVNIVELLINKGANDWEWGIIKACNNRHKNVIELIIKFFGTSKKMYCNWCHFAKSRKKLTAEDFLENFGLKEHGDYKCKDCISFSSLDRV